MTADLLGDDFPVFDRQCKCGRFVKLPKSILVNGFGEVVEAKAECSRCGTVEAEIIGWRSDFEVPV